MKIKDIKPHHDCSEGRHVFFPISWEEDIKSQTKWVTELSCQHCLSYVTAKDWYEFLKTQAKACLVDAELEEDLEKTQKAVSLDLKHQAMELEAKTLELQEKERFLIDERLKIDEFYNKVEKDLIKPVEVRKRGRPAVKK